MTRKNLAAGDDNSGHGFVNVGLRDTLGKNVRLGYILLLIRFAGFVLLLGRLTRFVLFGRLAGLGITELALAELGQANSLLLISSYCVGNDVEPVIRADLLGTFFSSSSCFSTCFEITWRCTRDCPPAILACRS